MRRRATVADAAELRELYARLIAEGLDTLTLPDEPPAPEAIRAMIESPDGAVFVAADGPRIAGVLNAAAPPHGARRHAAAFSILADPDHRQHWIGSSLLHLLFEWVEAHPRIFRLEAEISTENPIARESTLERLGFRIEGHHTQRYRTPGGFVDAITIARLWPPKSD